jgi:hypothetical protein
VEEIMNLNRVVALVLVVFSTVMFVEAYFSKSETASLVVSEQAAVSNIEDRVGRLELKQDSLQEQLDAIKTILVNRR